MTHHWQKTDGTSTLQVIAKAGHCANMDNAEGFNHRLLSFLQANSLSQVADN